MSLSKIKRNFQFKSTLGTYYINLRRKGFKNPFTKSLAVECTLKAINEIPPSQNNPTIIDFGCFDGSVLAKIRKEIGKKARLIGIDFNKSILKMARKQNKDISFYEKDLYADCFKDLANSSNIAICINTLHEIFSFCDRNDKKAIIDEEKGKQAIIKALTNIATCLKVNGVIILFDGIAPSLPFSKRIIIKFISPKLTRSFLQFAKDYKVHKTYFKIIDESTYRTNVGTFGNFITKYQFLNTPAWKIERDEEYQYFTKEQFIKALGQLNLKVEYLECLSPISNNWQKYIRIIDIDPSIFSIHVLIKARKGSIEGL